MHRQPPQRSSSGSSLSLSPKGRSRVLRLIAVHPYSSSHPCYLSFPARAIIEAKKGQDGNELWWGSYQGQHGWFPVGCCALQQLPAALFRAPSLPMLPADRLPAASMSGNHRSLSMGGIHEQQEQEGQQDDNVDIDSMNSSIKSNNNNMYQHRRLRAASLEQHRSTPPLHPSAATARVELNTAQLAVAEQEAPPSRVAHTKAATREEHNNNNSNASIELSRSRSTDSNSTPSSPKRGLHWFHNKKSKERHESPRSIMSRASSAHPQSPSSCSNKSQSIKSPSSTSSARKFFSLIKSKRHTEKSGTKVPSRSCIIPKNNPSKSDSSSVGTAASPLSAPASVPPFPLESIYIPSPPQQQQQQHPPSPSSAPSRMVRFAVQAKTIAPPTHKSVDEEPEDPIEVYAAAYRSRMQQMDELYRSLGGLDGLPSSLRD